MAPINHSELAKVLKRSPAKEATYYEQLGRFIAAYSSAEAQIHVVARHYARTDDTRARLIFGSLRVDDCIDRLRALLRIFEPPTSSLTRWAAADDKGKMNALIERCLAQFQVISERRDNLLHRPTIYYEDLGFIVSNGQKAKALASAEISLVLTLQELKDMKTDCQVIFLALSDAISPPADRLGSTTLPAWLYKPQRPAPRKPKHSQKRTERKRRRRVSRR